MTEFNKFKTDKNILPPIVMVVFTFAFFAPFEIYIYNSEELWFKLSMFWWIPIFVSLVGIAVLCWIGRILELFGVHTSELYGTLIFASGLCIWIQGNFLNAYTGVLNGSDFNWYNIRPQAIRDVIIWLIVFAASIFVTIKRSQIMKKIIRYVSLLLIGMQALTLIYLLIMFGGTEVGFGSKGSQFLSSEGEFEIGSEENVVVLLVDMFDDDYFRDIRNDHPELTDELDGFTYFENYTGLYPSTALAVTSFFTGEVFHNEMNRPEWIESRSKERLYLDELTDKGYSIGLFTDMDSCIPQRIVQTADNYRSDELKITDHGRFTIELYRLVACKYMPNIFKKYIWMNGDEFDGLGNRYSDSNKTFRDGLRENRITVKDGEKHFKYIHIDGMHFPYEVDEYGNDIPNTNSEPEIHSRGVFRIVLEYLEALKTSGIYDDTAIIITADHGYYADGTLTNPVYLVKPKNSRGNLKINDAPCSQMNFSATVLHLAGMENYTRYGVSDLDVNSGDEPERFYYQYYLSEGNTDPNKVNMRLIEYSIPPGSNDVSGFELTDREYTVDGEIIEHKKYCLTCMEGREWDTSTREYKPTLVHEASKDNPSYQYINTDFYELIQNR